MNCKSAVRSLLLLLVGCCLWSAWSTSSQAYITFPVPTLGRLCESTFVTVVRVDKVSKEKGIIIYRKVKDLKGTYPKETIKHIFDLKNTPAHKGAGDVPVRPDEKDWKYAIDWAEPGKTAVIFSLKYDPYGDFGHTYVDGLWYASMCPGRDWEFWYSIYSDPALLSRWHCGTPAQLIRGVESVLAGKEAVLPVLVEGTRDDLRQGRARMKGLKVSSRIQDYDPKRDLVATWLGKEAVPSLVKALQEAKLDAQIRAVRDLGAIGPEAKEAAPALLALLQDKDDELRIRSAEALVRIDAKNSAAIPVLVEAMKDPKLRVPTIDLLGDLGEPAKAALPALVGVLKDPRTSVRIRAADALLHITPANPDAISALVGLVDAPLAAKVGWAPAELTDLKSTGGATLTRKDDKSILVGGALPPKDTYTMVLRTDRRTITAVKLEALPDASLPGNGPGRAGNGNFVLTRLAITQGEGGNAKPVSWASAVGDFSQQGYDVGSLAAENGTGWAVHPELGKAHTATFSPSKPIVGTDAGVVLTVSVECQSPSVQHQLGRFRLLVTDIEDPLLNPRIRAIEMLGAVGPSAKAALPALMKVLADPDPSVRQAVTATLSRMAPDSVPLLAAALKDAKIQVRRSALDALAGTQGHAAPAVPALIEAWKDSDKGVRLSVGDVLQRLETAAGAAAPVMVQSLDDPDRDIRLKACDVLGRCGGPGRAAGLPKLVQILAKDPDKDLRARAAWVLGQMGPEAKTSAPALIQAVKEKEGDVRLMALASLGRIGADPKAVGPVAKAALDDPDKAVRIRAADLYGRTNPYGGGPTVELFEDNHQLLLAQLTAEDGVAEAEVNDKFSGSASIKVMPTQRYNATISGWAFSIVEKPELGEYRYIRYAWKKAGGNGIMLQLHTSARGWENRYFAGKNVVGWAGLRVDEKLPSEWTVVTRDLFKDFGGAFTLQGMALTAMDGTAAYYDHMYLGRTVEELDKVTAAKKNK